ncbi:MAG: GNAT family N-acetyltransferase [bacterium]|nr:GNAT family N-acetyltransferase [bacterium]
MIRKAQAADISAIAAIYEDIHTQEEQGALTIGWQRGVYPTQATAQAALARDDLYVLEEDGAVLAAAIINHVQVDVYANVPWQHEASGDQVLVLHTLVVSPDAMSCGLGKQFVAFYEETAHQLGCTVLRMDTNARNTRARAFYQKTGYREAGIVPCVFNGLEGVQLVCLEKRV